MKIKPLDNSELSGQISESYVALFKKKKKTRTVQFHSSPEESKSQQRETAHAFF